MYWYQFFLIIGCIYDANLPLHKYPSRMFTLCAVVWFAAFVSAAVSAAWHYGIISL